MAIKIDGIFQEMVRIGFMLRSTDDIVVSNKLSGALSILSSAASIANTHPDKVGRLINTARGIVRSVSGE